MRGREARRQFGEFFGRQCRKQHGGIVGRTDDLDKIVDIGGTNLSVIHHLGRAFRFGQIGSGGMDRLDPECTAT